MTDPSAGPPVHSEAPDPFAKPPTTSPAPVAPTDAAPGHAPAPAYAPTPGSPPFTTPGVDSRGRVKRTRVSGVWVGLITAAVFVILLIIFIAQNLTRVTVHFLGFDGRMSIGLIMLISAVCGLAVAAVPGSIRILQLRRDLKKNAAARSAV